MYWSGCVFFYVCLCLTLARYTCLSAILMNSLVLSLVLCLSLSVCLLLSLSVSDYNPQHRVVRLFWRMLEQDFSEPERRALLLFW